MVARRATAVEHLALALFAIAAWIVRSSPYFRATGVLGWAVDYDEGVYLSASKLLWQGVWPWRDFVFVHPPGVPVLLSFATVWDITASRALELARWGVTVVGALDVWLAALLVRRHAGLVGACVTAGLLAVWPEVVACDRGVHLEPFLSLACLGALWFLDDERPRVLSAGVTFGLAVLVKSWAVVWLGAWLLSRGRRALPGLVVAAVVGLVGFLPILLVAHDALEQLVWFHLWRPPDGDLGVVPRLTEMFLNRSVLPLVLLGVGLPIFWTRRGDVFTRHLLIVGALLVAAFLSAAAFWNQYDAHLALPIAILCGVAVQGWVDRGPAWGRGAVVGVLAGVLAGGPGLSWVLDRRRDRDDDQAARVRLLAAQPQGPICAFEVNELLMADRWPPVLSGVRTLVDPYGQMLLEATREGARFSSATDAFQSDAAQRTVRAQLEACPRWLLGWRGRWQLNDATRAGLTLDRQLDPLP
ncbi:MAG: glycosyltransferase family 39 protein [Myxococcaceae bacterium]|nr:glycosyltransferase family 39 protein [Myxococcaceae bacterium]